MTEKNAILLGSDTELFVMNPETGKMSSVAGVLGADKFNKKTVAEDVRIQEDNVLIEWDINPHNKIDSFISNIETAHALSKEEANKVGLQVVEGVCSHIYTEEDLKSFHKDAFLFGCEPSFNALTGAMNEKPVSKNIGLRTAGGHIHFGYSHIRGVSQHSNQVLGVMCDYFLGLPSLTLDTDTQRRELYGKAGEVRFKNYGVEYRTLSNFWTFNKDNIKFIWDQCQKAYTHLANDTFMEIVSIISPEEVQAVINRNDKKLAEQYIKLIKIC